jgi:hypothetical protein
MLEMSVIKVSLRYLAHLQAKLACHSVMDTETKDFIISSIVKNRNFTFDFPCCSSPIGMK